MCDDWKDLVLYDDAFLNLSGGGLCLISVLCHFCRALNGFSTVTLTSDNSLSTLVFSSGSVCIFIACLFYIHFVTAFAIAIDVDLSGGDYVYLHCSSLKGDDGISVRLGTLKPV